MSIIFMDGFEGGATTEMLLMKYDDYKGSLIYLSGSNSYPRTGTRRLFASGAGVIKNLNSNYSSLIVGFAMKYTNNNNTTFFEFLDESTVQCYLQLNSSGKILIKNGDGTTLATSTSSVSYDLSSNDYTYVEFKVEFGTLGSYTLKINGATDVSASNVNTKYSANSYANKIYLGSSSSLVNCFFDDFYIEDTDFLGALRIYTILPTSDSSLGFTPSTGSLNYAMVDDSATIDSDSTYVSTTSIGTKDLYGFGNLSLNAGVIQAVAINFVAKKLDLDPVTMKSVIELNSTEYNGVTKTLTTAYLNYQDVWNSNPNTSTDWAYSDIDAIIGGIES